VPGIVLYQLLKTKNTLEILNTEIISWESQKIEFLPFVGLLFTLAAAYRLAKFNIDERQTSSFIGLPTPAASLVVLSLPLILEFTSFEFAATIIENKWFIVLLTLVLSFLMNAEIPLFSLKFKNFTWKDNQLKFVFLMCTMLLVIVFQFVAIPLVILLYIFLSLFYKENKL
jgi:CDP-diacylglycerol--serine O-phosphatidyltransferase